MSIDSLIAWEHRKNERIAYYRRRKGWARRMIREHSLTSPGDSVKGQFEGDNLKVEIGPRGGVRIYGRMPAFPEKKSGKPVRQSPRLAGGLELLPKANK